MTGVKPKMGDIIQYFDDQKYGYLSANCMCGLNLLDGMPTECPRRRGKVGGGEGQDLVKHTETAKRKAQTNSANNLNLPSGTYHSAPNIFHTN